MEMNRDKLIMLNRDIENAQIEYKGNLWLIKHYLPIDNVIYYSHSRKFCFGWKRKLNKEEETNLREKLKGFPYKYYFGEGF